MRTHRTRAHAFVDERYEGEPFPWSRIWYCAWFLTAMLAWAGFWWAFAEWTK